MKTCYIREFLYAQFFIHVAFNIVFVNNFKIGSFFYIQWQARKGDATFSSIQILLNTMCIRICWLNNSHTA